MNRLHLAGFLLIAIFIVIVALNQAHQDAPPPSPSSQLPANSPSTAPPLKPLDPAQLAPEKTIDHSNSDPRFTRFTDGSVHWNESIQLSQQLHQNPDPKSDLLLLDSILSSYRLILKENPVGTDNSEFAAALSGQNPKNVTFLDPALISNGQLLDRWDSPYHFHPISANTMDIRSLGPDRKLWTSDDLTLLTPDDE